MVHQLPSSRLHQWCKWQLWRKLYPFVFFIFWFFTWTSEAMVVLHTHFALLYLRGGLCWDWGLACRRSNAIFTSENKSIQTLNITVTCKSAYAFTQNGVATPTLPRSKWKWAPISKLENPKWRIKMQQIELPNLSNWAQDEQEMKKLISPLLNCLNTSKTGTYN